MEPWYTSWRPNMVDHHAWGGLGKKHTYSRSQFGRPDMVDARSWWGEATIDSRFFCQTLAGILLPHTLPGGLSGSICGRSCFLAAWIYLNTHISHVSYLRQAIPLNSLMLVTLQRPLTCSQMISFIVQQLWNINLWILTNSVCLQPKQELLPCPRSHLDPSPNPGSLSLPSRRRRRRRPRRILRRLVRHTAHQSEISWRSFFDQFPFLSDFEKTNPKPFAKHIVTFVSQGWPRSSLDWTKNPGKNGCCLNNTPVLLWYWWGTCHIPFCGSSFYYLSYIFLRWKESPIFEELIDRMGTSEAKRRRYI